jgi:DNA-binding protein HU-beta
VNKQELVEAVAAKLGDSTPKKRVEETLRAILDQVSDTMRKGDSVQLVGFGTFEPRRRGARTARNPQTGEKVRVRAATVPAFKASQTLKDYVGKKPGTARSAAKKATKKTAKKAGKKTAKKAGKRTPAKKTAKKAARKTAKKTAKKR